MVDVGNIRQPVVPVTPRRPIDRVKREGGQNEPDNERRKAPPEKRDQDDDGVHHIDEYA